MITTINEFKNIIAINESISSDNKSKLYNLLAIAEEEAETNTNLQKTIEKIQSILDGEIKLDWKSPISVNEKVDNYLIFQRTSALNLANDFKKIINKYKSYEVSSTSVAAAPNSSTFSSTVGGDIKGIVNYSSSGGYYGFNKNYIIGLTIGGGIPTDIKDKIKQDVYEACFKYIQYNYSDGGVDFCVKDGTNFHTVGLTCSKYSFSDGLAEMLRNIMK